MTLLAIIAIIAIYILIGTLLSITIKPKGLFMYIVTIVTWPYFLYIAGKEIIGALRK